MLAKTGLELWVSQQQCSDLSQWQMFLLLQQHMACRCHQIRFETSLSVATAALDGLQCCI
jgi:hypothetical protein